MYKRLLFILIALLLSVSASANVMYFRTCLNGGTAGCLDALDITGAGAPNSKDLATDNGALVIVGGNMYVYEYDSAATGAEDVPVIIRPDDYSSGGNWILLSLNNQMVETDSTASPTSVTTAQARAGTFFFNSLSGTKQFDLPAAEENMSVCFRNTYGNSQIIQVDPNGSEYIVKSDGTRTSAGGDHYAATAGDEIQVCFVCDGTDWYVTSEVGTWAEE